MAVPAESSAAAHPYFQLGYIANCDLLSDPVALSTGIVDAAAGLEHSVMPQRHQPLIPHSSP